MLITRIEVDTSILLLPVLHYWRGHQTSPTLVSLKGGLPQKLQSKSTLSTETVQMHSLFRHGFIRNRNQDLTKIENRRILFL